MSKFQCSKQVLEKVEHYKNATINNSHYPIRNLSLVEIKQDRHMHWQRTCEYGRRNNSKLAMQRYKKILGN
jgi:hypothetical protein